MANLFNSMLLKNASTALGPVTRGLQAWYDFSDLTQLVVSGTHIIQALDKSGNGNDTIAQSTDSKRPIYTAAAQGGKAVAAFTDASLQTLQCPAALLTVPGAAYTLFESAKRNIDSSTQLTFNMGVGSGSTRSGLIYGAAGVISMKSGADASTSASTSGAATTIFNVLGGSYNGTTGISLSLNGASAVTSTGGSVQTGCDNCWIGSRNDSSFYFNGQVGDILLYNVLLTAPEMAQNFAYEKAKFGTP